MVKIIDITEEKEREMKQEKLEEQLAKECFEGKRVKLNVLGGIGIYYKGKNLAYKYQGPKMEVYVRSVLPQAETFAQKYEEQFHCQNDFIINTDYSKNK